MTRVVPITPAMFDEVYDAILAADDPDLGRADWAPLFVARAGAGGREEPCGWALRAGGRVVGMVGAIFSRRRVGEREVPFVNLHSWIVEPDHRGHSLFLLRPVLSRRDHLVTDFTPTAAVARIAIRLGFEPLDAALRILFPWGAGEESEVVEEIERIAERLDESGRRILRDHPRCGHLLVEDGARGCHVVWTRVDRYPLAHAHVHHVSDADVFVRRSRATAARIARRAEVRLVTVADRALGGRSPSRSVRLPVATRQLVRAPGGVDLSEIDTLYSEVALLRLPVVPDLSARIGDLARKLLHIDPKDSDSDLAPRARENHT